ncbi:hypothetical protein A2Y99_01815 [Candidatus Gottesmanbacteria bacterium RBG_13_37_7]|uniref:Uncharacterized protein n=1 Tax=Candidatus Gottesmanbacteria bacterium RBG_13_37_7 TaxID=1798369 RepID=A0A1F5YHU5_9BACT|nr:MAG: hypothetical protein A2Y99_01815 [Candidatus Gottesmanbacteria bacterium RBG_13_37_7]
MSRILVTKENDGSRTTIEYSGFWGKRQYETDKRNAADPMEAERRRRVEAAQAEIGATQGVRTGAKLRAAVFDLGRLGTGIPGAVIATKAAVELVQAGVDPLKALVSQTSTGEVRVDAVNLAIGAAGMVIGGLCTVARGRALREKDALETHIRDIKAKTL